MIDNRYVFWTDGKYKVQRHNGSGWRQLALLDDRDNVLGFIDDEDWVWNDDGVNAMDSDAGLDEIEWRVWKWA